MTTAEAAARLAAMDQVLILTHVRPDGDTIGSAAALCCGLRALGKTAYLLPNPELTATYAPYAAPYLAEANFAPAYVVSVDIAALSLLVGGIGVMNIMMVSVTERTREIGTRKALGAPASAIRMQFITESVILCLIGGFIGIVLGLALGTVLSNVVGYAAKPSIAAILIAVGFSMAIGVFFGYYPANKAAKLDPIEALRYE